jgi:hypothetical protein
MLECVFLDEPGASSPSHSLSKQECSSQCTSLDAIRAESRRAVPATWGTTRPEAIEVCLVAGEEYFLKDLRCKDGKAPRFERVGGSNARNPVGPSAPFTREMGDPSHRLNPGEVDVHLVDEYEVSCSSAKKRLFLDMYHCGVPKPWAAPAGFTRPPHG